MGVEVLLLGTSKKQIKGFKVNEAVVKNGGKKAKFLLINTFRRPLTLGQSTGCVV